MNELLLYLTKNANLANAFATVASAFIALAAFIISGASLYFSRAALKIQRRHNVLSLKPIPMISVGDYDDCLTIKLLNNGSGPLIIKGIQVREGSQLRDSIVQYMPTLPAGLYWSAFVGAVKERSLLPGNDLVLLKLTGDHQDKNFEKARDGCRAAISLLTVNIDYTDVYDSIFICYTKELSWFARNLNSIETSITS